MAETESALSVTTSDRIQYLFLRLGESFFRIFPMCLSLAFARWLGYLGYYLFPARRRVMLENLHIAFPGIPPGTRKSIARACCGSFAMGVVENFRQKDFVLNSRRLFQFDGDEVEKLRVALSGGKGAILLFFHYGNWELLVPATASLNLPMFNAVVREMKNPLVTQWLTDTRSAGRARILYRGSAGLGILRALKRGEMVAIACDMNMTVEDAVFVDFFGVPAATTPAPAEISLRYGTPVVVSYIERNSKGGYLARFGPVLRPEQFAKEEKPTEAMMLAINREIEKVIRRDPTQYLWGHRRWNTRPPGDTWKPNY